MKNRIHMLLMKNNYRSPFSDLFGVQGLRYLQEIALPDYHRQQVETYLFLYQELREQIEPLTQKIQL